MMRCNQKHPSSLSRRTKTFHLCSVNWCRMLPTISRWLPSLPVVRLWVVSPLASASSIRSIKARWHVCFRPSSVQSKVVASHSPAMLRTPSWQSRKPEIMINAGRNRLIANSSRPHQRRTSFLILRRLQSSAVQCQSVSLS